MTTTADQQLPKRREPAPLAPFPIPARFKPNKDPRYMALRNFGLSISIFNIFGYTLLGFEQPWLWPIIAVGYAYMIELTFEMISAWAQRRQPRFLGNGIRGTYEFLIPSHITALACNMLLYGNNQLWPVLFAVTVGVCGKHALQAPIEGRMRHYMNPSNFGITVTLLVFGGRWISIAPPYQFTENANTYFKVMVVVVILTAGTVLNAMLTKKTALIVGWLGGFAIQAFIRHWIWHVALFNALGVMSGVAFILFSNYMISDPGTTPTGGRAKFMFGSAVAMVYGAMMLFNVVYTLFFATTFVCAARGLYWWMIHFRDRRNAKRLAIELTPLPYGRPVPAPTSSGVAA